MTLVIIRVICYRIAMALVPLVGKLGKDKFAIIDEIDLPLVLQHRWWFHNSGYAFTKINKLNVMMHRLILGLKRKDPIRTDHKDANRLNNSRSNIRTCTQRENLRFKGPTSRNKSGFKGVVFEPRSKRNPWVAYIKSEKVINLGCFQTKELAAGAYNKAAKKYHGPFAWLNPL